MGSMVGGSLLKAIQRIAPLRLAASAGAVAVLAIGLFAAEALLRDDGPPPGVLHLDPAAVGLSELALDGQGILDSDVDGLPDALETILHGSDPGRWNSSRTPLPDGWLAKHGYSPVDQSAAQRPAAVPPASSLPDAYGNRWPERFTATLLDVYSHGRPASWDESTQGPFDNGLEPRKWDSNGDGLPDGWLLAYGLDPLNASIADATLAGPAGLTVREAFEHATDPRSLDSDGDGLSDAHEIAGPANPRAPDGPARFPPTDPSRADTSGSGACDGYLVANGLDPTSARAPYEDLDRDGATTLAEYEWSRGRFGAEACGGRGLDPRDPSSGGADIPDGWLIRYGLDPLDAGVANRTTQDSASDPHPDSASAAPELTLTVGDEYRFGRPAEWQEARDGPWWGGSDPQSNDTDGDGLGDAWEMGGYMITVVTETGPQLPGEPYAATLDPTRGDSDGDGLPDDEEAVMGSDGRRPDTDFDGLGDAQEAALDNLGLDLRDADSADDLLRDGERYTLLTGRSSKYSSDPTYEYPGQTTRRIMDLAIVQRAPAGAGRAADLFGPTGDLDGDRRANIVDADMDNDTLLNGPELLPILYEDTDLAGGLLPRSATDPLNDDTDGEGLRDDWEARFGAPDFLNNTYNLDPARWDSNNNTVADGLEDPDRDSVDWRRSESGTLRTGRHVHNNLEEQRAETDPNNGDSDGDGLGDGWEFFWGFIEVRGAGNLPNARTAQPANDTSSFIFDVKYTRYAPSPAALLADANDPARNVEVDVGDVTVDAGTLDNLTGTLLFRFHDAQRLGTSPHQRDTDGDGADDWWEYLYGSALPPLRDQEQDELGQCRAASGLDPTVPDGAQDPDQDGLANAMEFAKGGDPLCADGDLGGIPDGKEVEFLLKPDVPTDDVTLSDTDRDSDSDGVNDGEELAGKIYASLGSRRVRTDLLNPDTDGDGLLDGPDMPPAGTCWTADDPTAAGFLDLGIAYRRSAGCYRFLGEQSSAVAADPRDGDDCRCGVPTGWLAAYGKWPPTEDWLGHYRLGIPPWWQAEAHGPWWGGASPLTASRDDLRALQAQRDLDGDGLEDSDGTGAAYEDPYPAANSLNVPRASGEGGDARDAGAEPKARRLAAQAIVNPAPSGDRPGVPHSVPQGADQRAQTCLVDLRLDGVDVVPGMPALTLKKGDDALLTGRLLQRATPSSPCSSPASGMAVQGIVGKAVFGADFTDATGTFSITVNVGNSVHLVPIPPPPLARSAFRGNQSGDVSWEPDASLVPLGPTTLIARSYAAGEHGSAAGLQRVEAPVPVRITADARLFIELADEALTGERVPARILLTDSGGAPLDRPVRLTWDGEELDPRTPAGGVLELDLDPVSPSHAGIVHLVADSPASGGVGAAHASKEVNVLGPAFVRIQPLPRADAGQSILVEGLVRRDTGHATHEGVRNSAVTVNLTKDGVTVASGAATSGSGGAFEAHLDLPAALAFGSYDVVATAQPTPQATGAQAQQRLDVRSLPAFTEVRQAPLTAGTLHAVTATLREANGRPVPEALVEAGLGTASKSAATATNGTATMLLNVSLSPGTILQTLSYAGDDHHAPATHRSERVVLSATRLELPGGVVPRGADTAIPLRLSDANGDPVRSATLGVQWGDEPVRFVVTNATGGAIFTRPGSADEALGTVPVHAHYAGSRGAGLANSSASASWTVRSLASLEVPEGHAEAGGAVPFGRLIDAGTRLPLAGRTITLRVNDGTPVDSVTDGSGRFPLYRPLPLTAEPAALHAEASFAGDAAYPATRAAGTTMVRSPTTLTVRLPVVVVAGQPTLVSAEIVDARDLPAHGGVLQALGPLGQVGAARVQGTPVRIELTLPPDSVSGAATLQFRYLGSDTHGPSEAQSGTQVVAQSILHASAEPALPGGLAVLRVHLLIAGQPAPGQPVTVQLQGVPEGIVGTTDAEGTAVFTVTQVSDTLHFLARYGGDGQASPATSAGQIVAVQPAGFLERNAAIAPWFAAAAALVLGGAALVAWRTGRHPLAAAIARARRLVAARGDPERQILLAYRALEDAAIAIAVLSAPARTPRGLQDALLPTLPAAAHGSLDLLIGLFEDARYGQEQLGPAHRDAALGALRDIQRALTRTRGLGADPTGVPA